MNENEQRGLERVREGGMLPSSFHELSEEEQRDVRKRLIEQDVEIRGEFNRKLGQSKIAENDLAMTMDSLRQLDHDRKVYSQHVKGETGSGTYEVNVKGGDTRFLVPVLAVVGALVLGILWILAGRR